MDFRIGILGPLEVRGLDGTPVEVRGQLRRRLLLRLAAGRGAIVADADILDGLWPDERPRHAIASVRNMVAELRKQLGSDSIDRASTGYRLVPGCAPLDIDRFEWLVDEARSRTKIGELVGAADRLDRALNLVRGTPFDEVADELWAMDAIRAIEEQIMVAEEFWADLRLRSGHVGREVERLRRAANREPQREVRWRQLVDALSLEGRHLEALRVVAAARRALREFGLVPSRALLEREESLLAGPRPTQASAIRVPRTPMVGRFAQLTELGRGHGITWIDGARGSGRTRLVAEHADRMVALGRRVLYVGIRDGQSPTMDGPDGACGDPDGAHGVGDPDVGLVSDSTRWVDRLLAILRTDGPLAGTVVIVDDVDHVDEESAEALLPLISELSSDIRWILTCAPNRNEATVRLAVQAQRCGAVSIEVGPLDDGDLHELADEFESDATPETIAECVRDVMKRTEGHPAWATELLALRLSDAEAGIPQRVSYVVADTLARMSDQRRTIVELLALAPSGLPTPVIARSMGKDSLDLLDDVNDLVMTCVARVESGGEITIRHELFRDAVAGLISPMTVELRRQQLIDDFVSVGDHPVPFARFLLEAGACESQPDANLLDRIVYTALRQLDTSGDHVGAGELAGRYVRRGRATVSDEIAIRTQVEAARALIAVGQVRSGRAVLRGLWPTIRRLGVSEIHAEAILALGPVLTGGSAALEELLDDTADVARRLDPTDTPRRVQLLTWAAHHLVNRGRRNDALRLLRDATASMTDAQPTWEGLILAVRAQAETLVEAGPILARRSFERLADFAAATGDLPTAAAAAVLQPTRCFADGTIAAVHDARNRLVEIGAVLPRPDIRWWPFAVDAAIALAEGALDEAAVAIKLAEDEGEHLEVVMARSAAMAQNLLLMLHAGELASLRALLEPSAAGADAGVATLVTYGTAAAYDGHQSAAESVAQRLASTGHPLREAGMAWPQVAMLGSELAFALGSVELARALWTDLAPYSGTGLVLGGIGYFGSADRSLAMLSATLGDFESASRLAAQAQRAETRRGAGAWIDLAAAAIERIDRAG